MPSILIVSDFNRTPNRYRWLPATLILLLILIQQSHARTIFKYTDPDGTIHLTDQKPGRHNYTKIQLKYPHYRVSRVSPQVKEEVETELVRIAALYGLDARLVKSIATIESALNPKAVSPAGAMGIMQLIQATANRYAVKDPFDVSQNIHGGCSYLADLFKMFKGDIPKVLAAYNAGENAVKNYDGIPPYAETRAYVSDVLRLYEVYGGPRIAPPLPTRTTPIKSTAKIRNPNRIKRYTDHNGVIHLTNR